MPRDNRRPASVTLRSFQVGFGDCYLLTFNYKREQDVRHVLIDCGSTGMPTRIKRSMLDVTRAIRDACGGKLHAVVATHRHQDHISGFAGRAGSVIASLDPDVVVQPWTEDPDAAPDDSGPTRVVQSSDTRKGFVAELNNMQVISAAALTELHGMTKQDADGLGVSKTVASQLSFLGESNLKNKAAIRNLQTMGRKHVYAHYGSESGLEQLLPGVNVRVLGPPTLDQTESIRQQRSKDPAEFWHLQAAAGHRRGSRARPLFPKARRVRIDRLPFETRWFLPRLQGLRGEQLLQIVRMLDAALNNTSLILLFEVGRKKLLFPGDAQIENWLYALRSAPEASDNRKLLRSVDLYKVGHHGSLNATPKTLWKGFTKKGAPDRRNRIRTFMSTMPGKHGSSARGTEVPRRKLTDALESLSDHFTTESIKGKKLFEQFEIPV